MICLAVISPGSVHLKCAESITGAVTAKAVEWIFFHQSGPYLDDARNQVVELFYEPQFADCDRLLMVDSDIEFTPDDVTRLAEDDLPIVTGVYHSYYDGLVLPVVYGWANDEHRGMGPFEVWPDGVHVDDDSWIEPVLEVPGCGAGFLMIRRAVLDRMADVYPKPQQWFAEDVRDGVHYGEDLCFCIRAAEIGFPTYVDRSVQVAHHKAIRLGGRPQVVATEA